jgi:hypothetical protein
MANDNSKGCRCPDQQPRITPARCANAERIPNRILPRADSRNYK